MCINSVLIEAKIIEMYDFFSYFLVVRILWINDSNITVEMSFVIRNFGWLDLYGIGRWFWIYFVLKIKWKRVKYWRWIELFWEMTGKSYHQLDWIESIQWCELKMCNNSGHYAECWLNPDLNSQSTILCTVACMFVYENELNGESRVICCESLKQQMVWTRAA